MRQLVVVGGNTQQCRLYVWRRYFHRDRPNAASFLRGILQASCQPYLKVTDDVT
jgi:hypothetical protein